MVKRSLFRLALSCLALLIAACSPEKGSDAPAAGPPAPMKPYPDPFPGPAPPLFQALRDEDFYPASPEKAALGRLLFWDKLLSGNRNISCGTCHDPANGLGDGLSLPVGQGGRGRGPQRNLGAGESAVRRRVPRNAPSLYNRGARELKALFWDGRVAEDPAAPAGFSTPAGAELLPGLDDALAAQALFPLLDPTEMQGEVGQNEIADASGFREKWTRITERVIAIPQYQALFAAAFPGLRIPDGVNASHLANAIAAYESAEFRSLGAPFQRYLHGQRGAMSDAALRGLALFTKKARCASCHHGALLSDGDYHPAAMPQIGPGRGDGHLSRDDYGREEVTRRHSDRYFFRTPPLWNVSLSGPWGHDGAFASLKAVLDHYNQPVPALASYDVRQAILPYRADLSGLDFLVYADTPSRDEIVEQSHVGNLFLSEAELSDLQAFLESLTDPSATTLPHGIPSRVPSGIAVED